MKVAIIGGGFTGLACALELAEKKINVTLLDKEASVGGLAGGFKDKKWHWDLEFFYHHIFTNDKEIIHLAKKVGWPVKVKSPVTTSFINGKEIQLDSPISLLKFGEISIFSRIHMGAGLALLKLLPEGKFLEKYKVVEMLPKLIGIKGYQTIWEKLLKAKFGPYVNEVNMAWFWTRVAKRTKNLGYFEGGFQQLANKTKERIQKLGGEVRQNVKIKLIEKIEDGFLVDGEKYDAVVSTAPAPETEKLLGVNITAPKLNYLWGQTLILEIKRRFIRGYWMNILENNWPFLVAVEHTNMIDKKHYGNKRILYLGNYLHEDDKRLKMNKEELLKLYLPYLRRINKNFRRDQIGNIYLFARPYSQPVFPTNYSRMIPDIKTGVRGLYVANMSMVYPFDRGTNYAVKMGMGVAKQLIKDLR